MPKNNTAADTTQTTIPFSPPDEEQLDISTLETWLWDAVGVVFLCVSAKKNFPDDSKNSDSYKCGIYIDV